MQQKNVLLVEDSTHIQSLVTSLTSNICNMVCVADIERARQEIKNTKYSLIILDIVLPDGTGYEFCESLKKDQRYKDIPVIFLTGKTDVDDKVKGFQLGADDYLAKPFEPKEFVARIEAKLKKSTPQDDLVTGSFRINTISQKAFLKSSTGKEKDLDLTPIEYRLLSIFIRNEGRVLGRDEIKVNVWGDSVHVSSHTIDTHISSLRKKIDPFSKSIKSIVKQGYVFNLDL